MFLVVGLDNWIHVSPASSEIIIIPPSPAAITLCPLFTEATVLNVFSTPLSYHIHFCPPFVVLITAPSPIAQLVLPVR
ncbi:MAG: hypothetical protein HS131_13105 [Ignavibacteriales bacterium]|nr:hypothetical protein [Ignavibacteriales bacterium]